MDLDFDDLPSDHAAPAARAGARFKPKGRPQLKKKQVSVSTSQTTISTDIATEKISTQIEDGSSATCLSKESVSETIVSESGTINVSTTSGTLPEVNVDVFSRGVNWKPSILRACGNVNSEGKRRNDDIEMAPALHDDPRTQDSAVEDFAQTESMQTGEEECHLDMETLDIIQEEGMTSTYEQHTGKFQPKPRLLDPVIEEPESHYYVDDAGNFTTGSNDSEPMDNEESRNDFDTNSTFYGETQAEEFNIPEVPRETVPEEARNTYEHEEQGTNNPVIGDEENCLGNNTVEAEPSGKKGKKGKAKKTTTRKRKTTSKEVPNKSTEVISEKKNKSTEDPEKKKFKHSTRRQNKRTLEKELLETPDDEIGFLPIRDMLRLVEYKEWLEKKEAKGAPVVPPTQESSNNTNASNAWNNPYNSQDFGLEDEFAMEEGENQEVNVVKPDSPVNYQTYMKKTPRTRWSKQDTELFYEGIQEFGSNLSMVQQLFPDRTRQQIKLKFKLEERRYPLKLNDALSSRSKNLTHFHTVIKKLQEEAAAAKEAEEAEYGDEDEEEDGAETTTDVPNNEKTEETERAGVKESDGGDVENGDGGDEFDGDGDDDDFWNSYKSEM